MHVCGMQTLNKYIELHGVSGGDYLLGSEYSFAEVTATPFVHRATVVLPEYRGYHLQTAMQQQNLDRLQAWVKVSCC